MGRPANPARICDSADGALGESAKGTRQAAGGPAESGVTEVPQVAHSRAICRSLWSQPERRQQNYLLAEGAGVHGLECGEWAQLDRVFRDGCSDRRRTPYGNPPLQRGRRKTLV